MSDIEDPIDSVDDDLFGDDGDDDVVPTKEPVHEDDELASDPEGDSYARYRNDDDDQTQVQTKERAIQNVETYRHRIPKPKDGAVCIFLTCSEKPPGADFEGIASNSTGAQVHEDNA